MDAAISKKYDIDKRLGKGAYGIVWKARSKRSSRIVAVKKIFDAFRNETDAQRTFREIVFLREFNDHPNIIKLLNVHRAENHNDLYLVFEFMNTDLHHVIRKGNILKEIHIRFIMYQLFRATQYLHSGNVIHRDLKPSNVLVDCECNCKIADFGLARSLLTTEEGTHEEVCLTDYVATRWYRAPEILLGCKQYTKGVDLWSLGCILGEMLLGRPVFPGKDTLDQKQRIYHTLAGKHGQGLEKIFCKKDKDGVHLLKVLLDMKPERRLTAEESMSHPFVSQFYCSKDHVIKKSVVTPPCDDNIQLSVEEYRKKLYELIEEQKRSKEHRIKQQQKHA